MLTSARLTLRALDISDSELIRKWRFDFSNYNYFYEFIPIGQEQNKIWIQKVLSNKNEINFVIDRNDILDEEQKLKSIGMISILNIDNRNQKCEMGRVLVGDENSRKLGLATEAIRLLLEYCYNHLNMKKVYCEVFADNKNAILLYSKLDFEEEGLLKRHIYKNGIFRDIKLMALHKEKWQK